MFENRDNWLNDYTGYCEEIERRNRWIRNYDCIMDDQEEEPEDEE